MMEMPATLALIGGEEFSGGFEDVHAVLLGGRRRVAFLPTCAAHDGPDVVVYWCDLARRHLAALGATVATPWVVDRASADDADHARTVAEADLVYMGGGFPHVGMEILAGTRVLAALYEAAARGACLAGASAGAMMLCARSFVITPEIGAAYEEVLARGVPQDWDPPLPPPLECLGMVPRALCMPHFNMPFPQKWLDHGLLPAGYAFIGVEEQTALIRCGDAWTVRGRGQVACGVPPAPLERYAAGSRVGLPALWGSAL